MVESLLRHSGIVTLHDLELADFHFIFEQAKAVIVHSPWTRDQLRVRFPPHVGKTFVVPYGATALDSFPERFHQNHDWPRAVDAYEEIIELTAARQFQPQADRGSSLQRRRAVTSPDRLPGAS
jgi:hypothetical protein